MLKPNKHNLRKSTFHNFFLEIIPSSFKHPTIAIFVEIQLSLYRAIYHHMPIKGFEYITLNLSMHNSPFWQGLAFIGKFSFFNLLSKLNLTNNSVVKMDIKAIKKMEPAFKYLISLRLEKNKCRYVRCIHTPICAISYNLFKTYA